MKSIYILLTRSRTSVSRLIYLATADPYTHSAISFDEDLNTLYSFSRKYIRLPLPAGLHEESLDTGFFKKYDDIPCALYELKVPDDVYYSAKSDVEKMMEESDVYRYNIIGLILCKLNIPYHRKRHYFCSQFVSEILEKNNALELPKDTALMKPVDYTLLPELECRFVGNIRMLSESRDKVLVEHDRLASA